MFQSKKSGATTTTSVYGGNSPTLPRAIDIAESFADAIGNGSAVFDGDDDFIQVDNITLPNLEPYTITAWIKTTDVDQTQAIVLWGDQASYERRALILYNGGNGSDWTLVASTNGDNAQGDTTVTEGEWTHASITVTPSTKAYKIYMNGILDGSGTFSNTLVAFSNSTLLIGKSYYGEFFEGNISGVGIWYGELTQAQIQSVMESTSYAKIPASVKSTLGSEKVANATDWTDSNSDGLADNWTNQYSESSNPRLDYSIVTGNGFTANAQRFEVNDVAGNDRAIRTSATVFTSGTLYKVSFKYRASISSGSILVMDGGSGTNVTNITTHTGDAKLFETYYVAPTGSHLWFYMQNADANAFMEIDEVSVKEVINDLVAYYPLDADSSANGVTNDVTTGETLGSNTFVSLDNFEAKSGGQVSVANNEVTLTIPTGGDSGMQIANLAGFGISSSLGYADNDLAKISFEAKVVTNASGTGNTVRFKDNQGNVITNTDIILTTEYQTFTNYYVLTTVSGYRIPMWYRNGSQSGEDVQKFRNFSIQKVTSNTGVLK